MKNYFLLFISIILVTGLLIGCNAQNGTGPTGKPADLASPMAIKDGLGREVTFEQPAQKIISIAPSNTELLFAVGAGAQVAGRDEFSDYPEAARAVENVGGGFGALNTEAMVSLEPDLVLASQLTSPEQVAAIEKLGLKVFYLSNPSEIEGVFENILTVGKITGKDEQASALVEGLKARVAAVDEKIAGAKEKPLVFYQLDSTDPNAPWTAGPGSFIDRLIARAGGVNLGGKLADAYAQISIEQILIDNPGVILVGDYTWGGVTAEDVMKREGWTEMKAIQASQVFEFDDNLVSRPGPRLVDGLEALAKLLHPELFK